MKSTRFGSTHVRSVSGVMLSGIAFFCVSVTPARAALHVLQFTVPNTSSYIFALDDPNLNGKPTAKLTVTQRYGTAVNNHPIGVGFDKTKGANGMWTVFNEDHVNLPAGAAFNVLVGTLTTVNASTANSVANFTFFTTASGKAPYTPAPPAGKKTGFLFFTHNFEPLQTVGFVVAVTSHQGLSYNAVSAPSPLGNKWYIFTEDGAPPVAASYFVFDASTPPNGAVVFGHTSSAATINKTALDADESFLDDPSVNGKPDAVIFITPIITNYDKEVGVLYNTTNNEWTILNEDGTNFVAAKEFNVLVFPAKTQ